MEEKVNIELRSEKVRNIIGNEMPFFIRYGITIITIILCLVALVLFSSLPLCFDVLNHDGEPLGRFKLKSKSHSLALSSDEKYLYIQHVNPEMEIERILVADIVKKLRKS